MSLKKTGTRFLKIALFTALLLFAGILTIRTRGQFCLPIFSGAGGDALLGIDPYLIRDGRPDFFKYAPLWAVLLIPLHAVGSLLPASSFQFFWWSINAVAFILATRLYLENFQQHKNQGQSQIWNHTLLIILLTPLLLTNGFYGQINSLLWLLLAISFNGSRPNASRVSVCLGSFCLSLAIWMKLFPIVFLALYFFPRRHSLTAAVTGLLVGFAAGICIPILIWGPSIDEVFRSWFRVLLQDAKYPHLKLGLASFFPNELRFFLPVVQITYFSWITGLLIRNKKNDLFSRGIIESSLMVGVLMLSHMTEPPTLALLAPAVIWLTYFGRGYEKLGLLLLLVLLPSDFTPDSFKNLMGGQYTLKNLALIWMLAVLTSHHWRNKHRFV